MKKFTRIVIGAAIIAISLFMILYLFHSRSLKDIDYESLIYLLIFFIITICILLIVYIEIDNENFRNKIFSLKKKFKVLSIATISLLTIFLVFVLSGFVFYIFSSSNVSYQIYLFAFLGIIDLSCCVRLLFVLTETNFINT
jgi:hypothetical protein